MFNTPILPIILLVILAIYFAKRPIKKSGKAIEARIDTDEPAEEDTEDVMEQNYQTSSSSGKAVHLSKDEFDKLFNNNPDLKKANKL